MNAATSTSAMGSASAREPGLVSARRDIYGIVERNEQSYWTRIGVAFENRDGSWNLRLDYLPSRPDIKLQFREPRPREAEPGA